MGRKGQGWEHLARGSIRVVDGGIGSVGGKDQQRCLALPSLGCESLSVWDCDMALASYCVSSHAEQEGRSLRSTLYLSGEVVTLQHVEE